jgi:uncharacterized surface protein with fasciclin (FAS1) repeats
MRSLYRWLMVPASVLAVGCTDLEAPTAAVVPEASEARAPRAAASPNLVDVALAVNAETGEFSTLIAAVVAADLVDVLAAVGQRTVFAPTDAAFAELELDAESIVMLPRDVLADILLYHVAPGRRDAASVVGSSQIRMANGKFAEIQVVDGAVYIDGARIVATDVPASNGLIHVISSVLLP